MREFSVEKIRYKNKNYAVLTITDEMATFPDFPIFQTCERVDFRKKNSWEEAVYKLFVQAVKQRVVEEDEVMKFRRII